MTNDADSRLLRRTDIKFLLGLYRLICLLSLMGIAILAFLIYQRLPPTWYEWTHASGTERKALMNRRWVVGEVDVNGPVEVEVTNTVDVQGEVSISR